jgi:hypothetical protein
MATHDLHSYIILLGVPLFFILILRYGITLLKIFKKQPIHQRAQQNSSHNTLTNKIGRSDEGQLFSVDRILAAASSKNWWRDEALFQLERRAIFSKVGLHILLGNKLLTSLRVGYLLHMRVDSRSLGTTVLSRFQDSRSLLYLEKIPSSELSRISAGIVHIKSRRRNVEARPFWVAVITVGLMIREEG